MEEKNIIKPVLDDRYISGYHVYCLTGPVRVCFAGKNLCWMLGAEAEEIESEDTDLYAGFVHPADIDSYEDFISGLRHGGSGSLSYRLMKKDGSVIFVRDTVCVQRNAEGILFGHSVLTDITDLSEKLGDLELKRYIKALSAIYDDIFEFNYADRTVTVVHTRGSAMLRWVKNIPMQMKEATESWIIRKVPPEQQDMLRRAFSDEYHRKAEDDAEAQEIRYTVLSASGKTREYAGVFVKIDRGMSLFCCRRDVGAPFTDKKPEDIPTIRTFGYFDVFVGDKTVLFRNEKSKELLALLVDRRGGFISSEEAIGFLWEDAPYDAATLARYRKVALRLKNTLEEYGIPEIIESVNGKRRIIPERVKCDLYDHLSGKEEHSQLFKGSYLSNYSWAETTLAELQLSSK